MKINILQLALPTFLCLFIAGCLSETLSVDGIVAEPELALPIGKVSFELKDFIEDDTILKVSPDGLAQIIFREDPIATISTDSFLTNFKELWDLSFIESREIGVVAIDDFTNSGFFSLKAVVNEMSDPAVQQAFRSNDGMNSPLPSFDEPVNFDIGLAPFANYKNIEIDSGELVLEIDNGFSFGLEDVVFELYDNVTGVFIHRFSKSQILPGEKFDLVLDLKGKTINNEFFIKMPRFKSPGSATPVPIDLEQRMTASISILGLKIRKGEVELPRIELPLFTDIVEIDVDNNVKIKEANIKSGEIAYTILSEVNVPIEIKANLPTATKNGTPFSENIILTNGSATGIFDLQGYSINFGSDPTQPYNRLPLELEIVTPGSGSNLVLFDKTDKISAEFQLDDLEMENFIGNAGTYVQNLDEAEFDFDIDFSFLDKETQRLIFEDPKIKVFYKNSFGVPIEATIDAEATGHFGDVENLNPPKFILNYPTLANAGSSVSGLYEINSTNSGISDMLSIFPEKIKYSGQISVNPGNNTDSNNFISIDSKLEVGVDLELPLVFSTENIVFKDTISQEPISEENPEEVQSLILVLDYKNGMPFMTTVDLLGLDDSGLESTILENIEIKSSGIGADGRANSITEDRIEIELSREEINSILETEELLITVKLKTGNDGKTPAGVYTSDGIEVGLAARIQLKIEE